METGDIAKENLEQVHEHGDGMEPGTTRRIAVLIAVIAAMLAVSEMGEKSAQNAYLTHHIQASDDWAFFQAKNVRATVQRASADMMESLPTAADPAVRTRIDAARADAARLRDDPQSGDGSKQLAGKAQAAELERDHAFHRYHLFEIAVGALQISIVLASVAVVVRITRLAYVAAGISALAGLLGLGVALGIV
jgi:Domain of unknown function (DUF4337)